MSGYPALPCKLFRDSTDRNQVFKGKKMVSNFRQKLFQWYSRKPPPVKLAGKDRTLRKELLTDKADWRRSRPVRVGPKWDKNLIPPGWHLVAKPDGTFRLQADGYDPRSQLTKYQWVPELRRSLRPFNRAWRRRSPNLPVESKVNDLEFFHQTGKTDGYGIGGVFSSPSRPVLFAPLTDPVTWASQCSAKLGYISVSGDMSFVPWTDFGYTTDPVPGILGVWDSRTPTDQAALLARWQDKTAQLSIIALRRHYAKLQNQKIDLATELAQGMLTVNQMADIAKRVAKSILSLKKGRILSAFRILFPTTPKGAANDFLAWKYGIKPLIGDLQGAAEHLAEYILRSAPVKSNGHAKATYKEQVEVQLGSNPIVFGNRSVVYETREVSIRVKYGSSFSISDSLKRQAATLGFTNPKNVAWELLPLSFVVDWFLPIGQWLSGLAALDGLVLKESYKTVFIVETIKRSIILRENDHAVPEEAPLISTVGSGRGTNGYLRWLEFLISVERKSVYCKREVITLPDLPIPQFKNPISKGHVNSAVALFLQLTSK